MEVTKWLEPLKLEEHHRNPDHDERQHEVCDRESPTAMSIEAIGTLMERLAQPTITVDETRKAINRSSRISYPNLPLAGSSCDANTARKCQNLNVRRRLRRYCPCTRRVTQVCLLTEA